jgi:hypothetical protein
MIMDLQEIYLEIAPEHIADLVDTADGIIDSLKRDIPLAKISRPANMADDWFMLELAAATTPGQK